MNELSQAFRRGIGMICMICAVRCGRQMSSHTPVTLNQTAEAPSLWGWWDHDKGLASTGLASLPESSAMWKLTAAFLPPGSTGSQGPSKGEVSPQCQFWGRWAHDKAPSHSPSNPFLLFMVWQMYSIFSELLERIWKRWFRLGKGVKFILGGPHGFAGYRLQESWSSLLFLLSILSISACMGFFRAQFWHMGHPSYHWAIFL